MVMIGNVDQIMALVRSQLERMNRGKRAGAAGKKGRSPPATTDKSPLQALASLSDLPERDFARLLVGALLSREFGDDVARDPRFQSIIDDTWRILQADPELRAVMQDVRRGLQHSDDLTLNRDKA